MRVLQYTSRDKENTMFQSGSYISARTLLLSQFCPSVCLSVTLMVYA